MWSNKVLLYSSPTRDSALLDLVLATGDDLVGNPQVHSNLGDSDHHLVEFTIQQRVGKISSEAKVLDFRRANFSKLRRLVSEVVELKCIGQMGVQEGWRFLQGVILGAQKESIPLSRKVGKGIKKPPWLNRELQKRLGAKKEI